MTDVDYRFEHTATGVLGDKRETMLHNDLLQRPYAGHKFDRGYTNYPGEVHRYGVVQASAPGGVAAAISGWGTGGLYYNSKTGSNTTRGSNSAGRDFVALNKAAVSNGLTSAQQIYEFRATHDICKKQGTASGTGQTHVPMRRLPPSMVYGKPSRPPTPINQVMEHYYADEWLKRNRQQMDQPSVMKKMPPVAGETKTSRMRMFQIPVEQAPLWKLPRFSQTAQPQLQTFRNDRARETAFKYQSIAPSY